MKKITYLFFLATTLIVSSCSSNEPENVSNSIKYNGTEISITEAIVNDYGVFSEGYNYDFLLIGTENGKKYEFFVELFSPVIDQDEVFRSGTFNYNFNPTEPAFYFNSAYIEIDDQKYHINAGSIVVSGNGTNFRFKTDVTLLNDLEISVNYEGDFTYDDRK